ncbi:hypothetical protein Droror1_Dr00020117 [Drosera rotundifolia]
MMMDPKTSFLFALLSFLIVSSPTFSSAFNITRLLNQHPEFGTFNDLLSQTGVAEAINSRQTITVLVVNNDSMGGVAGKPQSTIRNILATHVILDYYDKTKLSDLSKKSTLLTTLFQTTGIAGRMQGFLNITRLASGEIVVGSAVQGAELNSKLTAVVAAQPYNISVLQVSQPIVAPGIDQTGAMNFSSSPPPKPMEAPKSSPEAATPPSADAETPTAAEAPAKDAADAPSAPEAKAPAEDESTSSPAPAPSEDEEAADDTEEPAKMAAPAPKSAAGGMTSSMTGMAVGLLAVSMMF